MMRAVLAVIVGYLVMAIFVAVGLMIAYSVLGSDAVFVAGTTDVTALWLSINIPVGFLAALLGGWLCALIAANPRNTPVKVLAGLVLVFGLVLAAMQSTAEPPRPPKPISQMSSMEAGAHARQPRWYGFTIPLVGAAGVLLGGAIYGRRRPEPPPPADTERMAA